MDRQFSIWEEFLQRLKEALLSHYRENLLSIVVFGSCGRGDFRMGSDLDLLILLDKSEDSLGKRIDEFMGIERELRKLPEYARQRTSFPQRTGGRL
jgi:predicted nucleotidyltransferase